MAVRMTFSFYGDTQLDRTLARFQERPEDARPVWDALADRFATIERRQFKSEGKYASGGWAPLSPQYAKWKAKRHPGAKILHLTGDLERSLTQRPFGVEVIERHSMAIGSNVPYGKYHQNGTDRMPQRRPVEFTEAERARWVRTLQRYLMTGEAVVK
ncbi:phage virion morphogenesis protein [Kribbella catacumbae]|uniref:phage virion morphogenesis protein n=1 Tax=Kribbella catacumbae TaxID=460086 RepID=UPI0003AAA32C|nr:phage virion morphogenesis protein [Kribbella catacumbae]